MSYYKKIFKNKIRIAGSKGAKPSFLLPPSSAYSKIGFQIYDALDLLSEGPVAGLVDTQGKFLSGTRAKKNFSSDNNVIGSSTNGIDKGIYFDEKQLRLQNNDASHSKYDVEFKDGREFQTKSSVFTKAKKVEKIQAKIIGAYSMSTGGDNGARTGNGSKDIRDEGKAGRDFVSWQNYVPKERNAKPFDFLNYDRNVDTINLGLQIDQLYDTKSFATAGENNAGASKMGTQIKETVTFQIFVGKVTKSGAKSQSVAQFSTRAQKGKTAVKANGTISITGIITNPYTLTLEGISLPTLNETDAYNFIQVKKIQFETISNLVKREVGIGTITYINSNDYLYPNSAYVATSIDSKYYPQVPSRTFRLKGKKILIPSNYTPINTDGTDRRFSSSTSTRNNLIYDGDWNGTFKLGWSDNPAWIYYDLLINTRYGIGNYLRDTDVIDKWTLYEMGQYCDAVTMNDGSRISTVSGVGKFIGLDDGVGGLEPRFSCNILIKDQASAFEALQDLARSFRAMSYFNNSCVSVKIDRPHFFEDFNRTAADESTLGGTATPKELKFPPHLIFNNLNVNGGIFAYADVDKNTKLSALEVSFLDKQDNFRTATEYVEDAEAIKSVGLNFKSIDGIGVTSRSQAHRLAKYVLFESLNTTETVSFGAGTEALLLEPGDIIRVDDEMRSFAKNYGTVIGTSGETTYYNPDKTGEYNTFGSSDTGIGPKAIIVQPAINSTQFTDITGNIHVYNSIGKSGIEQFYDNPSANNQLYKEIHNPSVISLKIKEGGSGTSFYRIDNDVENSGAYLVFVDGVHKFNSSAATGSQWFSEKDALIKYGYNYSVDVTGREPKYYRVIGVEEDTRNNGFNVSATIHHTGKFKFVEENVRFDLDQDTFSPDLKVTDINRPAAPVSLTTGDPQKQSDNRLNFPLTIEGANAGVPQKYDIFLVEPNQNILSQQVFSSSSSKFTDVTLSGNFALDQIGEYELNIFSRNTSPTNIASTNAISTTFTTTLSDFEFSATNKLIDYQNISLQTEFDDAYSAADNTGSGNLSYPDNDENINAVFDLTFEDIFGREGAEIIQDVSGQRIDLLKADGTRIGAIKNLTNEVSVTISNDDLNTGFSYTGDGRFRMASSINFEANGYSITGNPHTETAVSFDQTFSETPVVFTQETFSGFHDDIHKKLGRVSTTNNSFIVTGRSDSETNYAYIATLTGRKVFDGGSNIIETNFVSKNGTTGFQAVEFSSEFPSDPRVIIQLQQADPSQSKFSETTITGVSTTGFHFAAFQDNTVAAGGTGQYAYLAVSPTNTGFNNETGSDLPIECLNYATTGVTNFDFDLDLVLDEFNGTSVAAMRFNHDQYAVMAQRSGNDESLIDKFFNIHRFNNRNRVFQHLLTTGLTPGLRSRNPTGSTNHIFVNTGSGSATGFSLTGVGSGMIENTHGSFDGTYTGGANLYQNTLISGFRIKTSGTNNTWILTDDDPSHSYTHDKIAWSGGENVNHPLNVTLWSGGNSIVSGLITDSNTPLANVTTTGFHNLQINDLNVETGDFSMIAFARFNSNLNGKQYLLESHKNGTGIAWFQSGDGKNYVNLNGVDYLAITGNGGASLNDGNVHLLQVVVDRDIALTGYLDGVTNTTINTNIIEQSTGFTVANVGSGMPQNTGNFDGDYTGAGTLYQNITSSGLRIKTSGLNNTWILVDEDPAISYSIDSPIAYSGGENINHPANVSSWTGTQFYSGFTVSNVGSGMVNNTGSFNGDYTGGGNVYINTTTSGLRLKQTGANKTWVFSDDDPANTYFTGFTLSAVGSGMADNPNSFNGTYTGGAGLYVNTVTSGLRIKTTGTNNTWILCDDDPANSYSHNRIAWSGGENVNFPGNVTSWTGGATILDGTITDSVSPLSNFSSLLSHNRIAWSGGVDENFPWTLALSDWTGGQTVGLVTTSAPGFTNILSGTYPGSSAPTFSNLLLENFDSQTGFKLLGNSELPGSGLTSGHIINYVSLTSGLNKADYVSNPNSFVTNFSGNTATEFLVQTDSFNNLKDTSVSNRDVNIIGDNIERSESVIDRTLTSNFHFFQIGVTGTL